MADAINLQEYVDARINKLYCKDAKKIIWKEKLEYQAYFLACAFDSDITIIIYIARKYQIEIYKTDCNGNNAFIYACYYNPNLNIIKILIKQFGMDFKQCNNGGESAFFQACLNNSNKLIIKYFIKDLLVDINQCK